MLRRSRLLSGEALKSELQRLAQAEGFDVARVTHPDAIPEAEAHLSAYVSLGYHGDMGWMAARSDERSDPRRLWPEVRSIILLGLSYSPEVNPLDGLGVTSSGLVSAYAQGIDYHDVMKPRLKAIARGLIAAAGEGDAKVFVDTAPVMEKPLAAAAGVGWQGKHTVVVSRQHGSWLFLGAIYTTLDLPIDPPHRDHCGSCHRCLSVCPTDAFPAPYQLDARRCLAYLTVEHKGPIPRELRAPMGNRVYGCDDCLAVCPWNRFAGTAREQKLAARRDIGLKPLAELLTLDGPAFRALFAKTPVKRTGRDRFMRNCLIAAGNSGDAALVPPVRALLGDASPLVRGAAVWALARLDHAAFLMEGWRVRAENNADVLAEWAAEGVGRAPARAEAEA